jgi:signal transduction histidine kinase
MANEPPEDPQDDGSREALREELQQLRARVRQLERELSDMEYPSVPTSRPALEKTLDHLLQKVTMILRAEKCCIMVYDSESNELAAQLPAVGLNEEQVRAFHVRASEGISGEVFRTREPQIFHDAVTDPRTVKENVAVLGVNSGATVPLIHERKDADVVVDSQTIGVLHVFNKRRGKQFTKEDLRILRLMAKSAAAVIAEARLFIDIREKKEELERTYDSLPAGIIMVSPDGRIRLMNREARKLMLSDEIPDPIGCAYQDAVTNGELAQTIGDTMIEKRELEAEISIPTVERIYRAQSAVVYDDGAFDGVVAIFSDVTDLRNLERMKSAFVTTVSHELRTPLTSIQGFTRTLLDDETDAYPHEVRAEFLGIIDKECRKLNRLVDDLQKVARIDEGHALEVHVARVDIGELLKRVVDAHRAYCTDHTIKLGMTPDFQRAPLLADEDKIDQIVSNLLSNAIKYSAPGTEVLVTGKMAGNKVTIAVHDQGVGIPEGELQRVFERFYRGRDDSPARTGGTGLGLYIVKHLVERLGGAVWADSTPGEGSVFTVQLPLSPEDG